MLRRSGWRKRVTEVSFSFGVWRRTLVRIATPARYESKCMATLRRHILLVEDEPSLRDFFCTVLEREGFETTAVSRRSDAFRVLDRGKVDLLLCDVFLGADDTGMQVIREARRQHPEVACLLMTGLPNELTVQTAEEMGVHMLWKPVAADHLLSTLRSILPQSSIN